MAAYPPEIEANESVLTQGGTRIASWRIDGIVFQQVRFEGRDLLLFPSGVSMVNAAMNTQKALDHFQISHVFFAGIAGGINPERHIGDVVIPERWYHHSEAAYLNPRPDGTGYVLPDYFKPKRENLGFIFPDSVEVIREGMDKPESQEFFDADPQLLAIAREAIHQVPPIQLGSRKAELTVGGNGISGPVFLDNRQYRQWAFRVWKADCLDMESTAIAQVCWANRTPFLIVRSLSDLAGGQEGINDADRTERPVSRHASVVLREILRRLPAHR
ncbi:MAG: 5'-methylthioadenosine/S-adenosylhomocysteine nucleosidase [Limisphaerales bacterium]